MTCCLCDNRWSFGLLKLTSNVFLVELLLCVFLKHQAVPESYYCDVETIHIKIFSVL